MLFWTQVFLEMILHEIFKTFKTWPATTVASVHFRNSKNNISADIVGGREARKEVERILGWIDRAVS